MRIVLDIPDEIARLLGLDEESAARALLENTVAQAYREEKIGTGELRAILDLSWYEKEQFLSRQKVYNDLTSDEIRSDIEVLNRLSGKRELEKTAA